MTTAAALIEQCRNDYLHVGAGGARNKLNGAVLAADETITLRRDLRGLQAGSKISIGLEDIHVWSVDASTRIADVDRGEYGSTAANHADNTVVYVDPGYTDAQILRAMNSTASRLVAEGIYRVAATNVTYTAGTSGYDITGSSGVLAVLDVWADSVGSPTGDWSPIDRVKVQYGADPTDYPSGTAIHLQHYPTSGSTLRIRYKSELQPNLAALNDVVETVVGLETTAVGLLALGAAIELTAGKEVDRNQLSAANSRRDTEVPAGAWAQSTGELRRLFKERVTAERRRLADKHPERIDVGAPSGLIALRR